MVNASTLAIIGLLDDLFALSDAKSQPQLKPRILHILEQAMPNFEHSDQQSEDVYRVFERELSFVFRAMGNKYDKFRVSEESALLRKMFSFWS